MQGQNRARWPGRVPSSTTVKGIKLTARVRRGTYFIPTTIELTSEGLAITFHFYDAQGREKTMTTWTNFPASSGRGAAVTTWNYDPHRGWLTSKLDNSGNGNGLDSHTAAGRLSGTGLGAWERLPPMFTMRTGILPPSSTITASNGQMGSNRSFVQCALDNMNCFSVTNGFDSLLQRISDTALNGSLRPGQDKPTVTTRPRAFPPCPTAPIRRPIRTCLPNSSREGYWCGMVMPEDITEGEWAEWYRMTPSGALARER